MKNNLFEWNKLADVVKKAHQKHGALFCVEGGGNNGDTLIYMGAKELLKKWGVAYEMIKPEDIENTKGGAAILFGGGGFCKTFNYHHPKYLNTLKKNFTEVIVFPTSFDPDVDIVLKAITGTNITLFCRDPFSQVKLAEKNINSFLSHDTAFALYDSDWLASIKNSKEKELICFRGDEESSGKHQKSDCVPNISFEEFFSNIARASKVTTDRLHVSILAAMLGKEVDLYPSNYHKIYGVYLQSLSYFNTVTFHG